MSDDNITKVVVTSDGKLIKETDLPTPGSDEWIKAVLLNLLRPYKDKVAELQKILIYLEHKGKLQLFLNHWLGELIELLATPMEIYLMQGRSHLPAELPESSDEIDFAVGIIADLCRYCGKDETMFKHFISDLNRGQLYTFVYLVTETTGKVLQICLSDNDD